MNVGSTGPTAVTWVGIFEPNCVDRIQHLKHSTIKAVDRFNLSFCKIVPMGNDNFCIDIDGSIKDFVTIKDYIKSINPDAKIYVTLGGTGEPDSFPGAVSDSNFPSEILSFLREYDLDGIDIDWEEGIDKTILSNLCVKLYETLNRNGKGLTLCTWPGSVEEYYDPEVLERTTDGLLIMSYGPNCDIKLTMAEYHDNGFHFSHLAPSIISEGGDGVIDTLEPLGGTVFEKADFARKNQCMAGCSWQLNNDSCTDDPDLPTGLCSDYFIQYLRNCSLKQEDELRGDLESLRKRRITHNDAIKNCNGPFQKYLMSQSPPVDLSKILSVSLLPLRQLPVVLTYDEWQSRN
ncbi:MAG: glycoside hydrolase family 18 protein [Parachlamydiaceae bacterium]